MQLEQIPKKHDGESNQFNNTAETIVKGLSYHVTEDQIWEFFGKYGTISSVKCLSKDDGTFRGVCFIKYEDQEGMEAAVAASGTPFEGRSVWIEKTKPKEQREQRDQGGFNGRDNGGYQKPQRGGNRFGGNDSYGGRGGRDNGGNEGGEKFHTNQESTIFVGNLTFNTTEDSLWSTFDKIGNIKEVRIGKHPDGTVKFIYN